MTAIAVYGYDSFPFLHCARRCCLPYHVVLQAVACIERGDPLPAECSDLDEAAIRAAHAAEQERRRA